MPASPHGSVKGKRKPISDIPRDDDPSRDSTILGRQQSVTSVADVANIGKDGKRSRKDRQRASSHRPRGFDAWEGGINPFAGQMFNSLLPVYQTPIGAKSMLEDDNDDDNDDDDDDYP